MTSGSFQTIPISSIIVERGERQRREVRQSDIDELAESIHRIGLINPPVITRDGILVAGETRLLACKSLGWTAIPIQYVDDLPVIELRRIELEENVKRRNLTWQDECLAVHELHELSKAEDSEWTQQKTADTVGLTAQHIGRQLEVARELVAGNEKVTTADKFSVAHNAIQRTQQRKQDSVLEEIDKTIALNLSPTIPTDVPSPPKPVPSIPIINADFHEWQESYNGNKFNLIHCDFPYGINVADSPRQNSAIKDYYNDSPDVYWSLLERLSYAMDNVVADSAHLIFWFSMDYYSQTVAALTEMGWTVNTFPLIWHKIDNAGIAPDPQRGPRRIYETALFAYRGDRKLTESGTKGNAIVFPGKRGEDDHISQKPLPVLNHFMSMVCDEYSTVLDPTCGSGNSLLAALALGANGVQGIELNEEFYNRALNQWSK